MDDGFYTMKDTSDLGLGTRRRIEYDWIVGVLEGCSTDSEKGWCFRMTK